HRVDLVLLGARRLRAALAQRGFVPDRQDQPGRAADRPFSRVGGDHHAVRSGRLARPAVALVPARRPAWAAFARDLLPRHLPVLCRPLRVHRAFRPGRHASACEHSGYCHNVGGRRDDLVVQEDRRTKSRIAFEVVGRGPRGRRGMREWTAAAGALLASLGTAFAEESPACAVAANIVQAEYPMPHVAQAVDKTRQLDIAVVGAGSSTLVGPGGTDLAYPARLQVILEKRLPGIKTKVSTNVKSRRTAAEMAEGLEKLLMEEKPALVIWQSGTVDAITGVDPEDYRATLDEGVEALHAGGADVILMNQQYSPR